MTTTTALPKGTAEILFDVWEWALNHPGFALTLDAVRHGWDNPDSGPVTDEQLDQFLTELARQERCSRCGKHETEVTITEASLPWCEPCDLAGDGLS